MAVPRVLLPSRALPLVPRVEEVWPPAEAARPCSMCLLPETGAGGVAWPGGCGCQLCDCCWPCWGQRLASGAAAPRGCPIEGCRAPELAGSVSTRQALALVEQGPGYEDRLRDVEQAVYRRDGAALCFRCGYVEVAAPAPADQHPCPLCVGACLACGQAAGEGHALGCMEMGLQPLANFLAEKEEDLRHAVTYGALNFGAPCPECSAPATKDAGACNTITCVCGTHFCFLCGVGFGRAGRDPHGGGCKTGTSPRSTTTSPMRRRG